VVDVMQFEWSGKWPGNRAPHLNSFTLNGKKVLDGVYLSPGKSYPIVFSATDPEGDQLTARWEILPEATDLGQGGDRESRPQPLPDLIENSSAAGASLKAPAKEGAYRLFLYVSDGKNKVATANMPFFVKL